MKNSEITLDTVMYWYNWYNTSILSGHVHGISIQYDKIWIIVHYEDKHEYNLFHFHGYHNMNYFVSHLDNEDDIKNVSTICSTSKNKLECL